MKYLIVGCRKCGTTSLEKYLKAKHGEDNVKREERFFTRYDGPCVYEEKFLDYKPVIILRDPVERAWSDYNYQKYKMREGVACTEGDQLIRACGEARYDPVTGERGIILQSQYEDWMKKWKKFNPLVYHLEDVSKRKEFPHEWKNDDERYRAILPAEREIIMRFLS